MKKNLIIIVAQPLNYFNYYKWGFDKKFDSKWNIKFWNLLRIEDKKIYEAFSSKNHQIKKSKNFIDIKNILHLKKEIDSLPKDFFYINLSIFSLASSITDRLLKFKGGTCIFLRMNKIPEESVSIIDAITYIYNNPYKLSFVRKIIKFPFASILSFICHSLMGKPELFIVPNQKAFKIIKAKYKDAKIKRIHSYDYELFMKSKSKINKKDYAVFIDQDRDNHFDFKLTYGGQYWIKSDWYWKTINELFSHIESKLNLKIIIAAHHRRSTKNLPSKRKFIFNKTLDLVRNCKLVIGQDSTALNQAILYKKKIALINFDEHKKLMGSNLSLLLFSKLSGTEVVNLSDPNYKTKYSNLNKFKINKKKYQNYINNWIKPRDIENIPIWTTIIKTLDEFNKEKFK